MTKQNNSHILTKSLPKLLIFASGSKVGGGSGFENLVKARDAGVLQADIVGVVSNRENGGGGDGVREKAERLGIPFIYFPGPFEASEYQRIVAETGAEFVALSGWLKFVRGLDPRTTINVHPAPLPGFGGEGMYGHYAHEAVMAAYARKEITHSAVSMHFVIDAPVGSSAGEKNYDKGPVFFRFHVPIEPTDTPKTLAARVNTAEHRFQPMITNRVIHKEIIWDGVNYDSLAFPSDYKIDWRE